MQLSTFMHDLSMSSDGASGGSHQWMTMRRGPDPDPYHIFAYKNGNRLECVKLYFKIFQATAGQFTIFSHLPFCIHLDIFPKQIANCQWLSI